MFIICGYLLFDRCLVRITLNFMLSDKTCISDRLCNTLAVKHYYLKKKTFVFDIFKVYVYIFIIYNNPTLDINFKNV